MDIDDERKLGHEKSHAEKLFLFFDPLKSCDSFSVIQMPMKNNLRQ